MATGIFTLYGPAKRGMLDGTLSFGGGTFAFALLKDTYTPAAPSQSVWSDVSALEASGQGYTGGGVTVSASVSFDSTSGKAAMTTGTAAWSNATIAAKYAVLIKRNSASSSPADKLVGYLDLNDGAGSISSTNGAFSVAPSADGWIVLD